MDVFSKATIKMIFFFFLIQIRVILDHTGDSASAQCVATSGSQAEQVYICELEFFKYT